MMRTSFFLLRSEWVTKLAVLRAVERSLFLTSKSFVLLEAIPQHNYKQQLDRMRICRSIVRFGFAVSKFNSSQDYYKVLGLTKGASPDDIKKSFKNLAKKYHPDANNGTEQKFKEVNEAYQILSDQSVRKEYDKSRQQPKTTSQTHQRQKNEYYQYYQQQKPQRQRQFTQEEFREHMRKKHEQMMRHMNKNRSSYDHLGRGYDNYERFTQQTLKKKMEQHFQKERVTQDSVRRQEEIRRKRQEQVDRKYYRRKEEELKRDMQQKFNRAVQNSESMIDGFKKMGNFVKQLFKKK